MTDLSRRGALAGLGAALLAPSVALAGPPPWPTFVDFHPLPQADPAGLTLGIAFVDEREGKYHGTERIGTVRGGYGNPFALQPAKFQTVQGLFTDHLVDVLGAVGYQGVPQPLDQGRNVELVLQEVTCDGYGHYRMVMKITLRAGRWSKTFEAEEGSTVTATPDQIARGFRRAFLSIAKEMGPALASKEFRAAVGGASVKPAWNLPDWDDEAWEDRYKGMRKERKKAAKKRR